MRLTRSGLVVIFLLGALIGVLVVQALRLLGPTPDLALKTQAATSITTDYEKAIIGAVNTVSTSVVSVRTSESVPSYFGNRIRQGMGT
ncbi:MAG: hypothetical protein KY468_18745, partial [Armatimonadetes bacterium]|nr:hypothetical protein [Armatimonadota bacterium]